MSEEQSATLFFFQKKRGQSPGIFSLSLPFVTPPFALELYQFPERTLASRRHNYS